MLVRFHHTASLLLPPQPGYPLGYELGPGDNDVPDEYFAAVASNPTLEAYTRGGLVEVVAAEALAVAAEPEPEPEPKKKKRDRE